MCIQYLDELTEPTKNVVIRHIAVSAQILSSGGKVSNCLFHPSVKQAVHQKYADEIMHVLSWCVEHKDSEFTELLKKEYDLICPAKTDKIPYEYFINKAYELLDSHSIKVLVMNGKTDVDSAQYENA